MSNQMAIYWTFGYSAYLLLRTDNNKHETKNHAWNEKEKYV